MPRFEITWINQPVKDDYKLIKTDIVTPRDVLDAVLATLPKGEYTILDVEEEQRLKHEAYMAERKIRLAEIKASKNYEPFIVSNEASEAAKAGALAALQKIAQRFQAITEDSFSDTPESDSISTDNYNQHSILDVSGSLSEEEESEEEEEEMGFEMMEDDSPVSGEDVYGTTEGDSEVYRPVNDDIISVHNCYRKEGVNEWGSFDKVETLKIKRRNLVVDQFLSENE